MPKVNVIVQSEATDVSKEIKSEEQVSQVPTGFSLSPNTIHGSRIQT